MPGGKKRQTDHPGARPSEQPALQAALARQRLLAALLPALEAEGMALSPDRFIRLQHLLALLDAETAPEALGPWLCPVFATDPRRQAAFYRVFDTTCARAAAAPEEGEKQAEQGPTDSDTGAGSGAAETGRPTKTEKTATRRGDQTRPNRRLVAELERGVNPPYTWNLIPPDAADRPDILPDAGLARTHTLLRRREEADALDLDLAATLKATIEQGGVPAFRHKKRSRPAEYLLLIEKFSANDHRAGLFDRLYADLRAAEVLIERFFFDGDPRRCYNERYPAGLDLRELRHRYPDAALLLLGYGYRLLSPRSGKPFDWAEPIPAWRRRALLTPAPHAGWGRRERNLAALFAVLPAATESLRYVAESEGPLHTARFHELPGYLQHAAAEPPIALEKPFLGALAPHFDPDLLAWIAACAVWPALHFELTLRLGRLLSPPGRYLPNTQNLLALTRLPWFADGYMPPEARGELLDYLDARHPDARRKTLDYLYALALQHQPPDGSVAYAEQQINLALLDALRNPDPDPAKLEELRAVVKYLDRPEEHWDFVLPAGWEKMLGEMGVLVEGEKDGPTFPIPEMVRIPGGTFRMGSDEKDKEAYDDEKPAHTVSVKDFEIGKYQTTVAQFKAFVDDSGYQTDAEKQGTSRAINDKGSGDDQKGINWRHDCEGRLRPEAEYDHPVVHVSWNDAKAYCDWLSRKTGEAYRLPTEAEWEYAAGNGAKHTRYSWGNDAPSGKKGGNVADETAKKKFPSWTIFEGYTDGFVFTAPVGSFDPNDFGLYDMTGNVWEWCEDWFHDSYKGAPADGSAWLSPEGSSRVRRGGSWDDDPQVARVAYRGYGSPDDRDSGTGFRLARTL